LQHDAQMYATFSNVFAYFLHEILASQRINIPLSVKLTTLCHVWTKSDSAWSLHVWLFLRVAVEFSCKKYANTLNVHGHTFGRSAVRNKTILMKTLLEKFKKEPTCSSFRRTYVYKQEVIHPNHTTDMFSFRYQHVCIHSDRCILLHLSQRGYCLYNCH
jgi:hypothetical protein